MGAKFVGQFVFHSVARESVMFLLFDAQSVFKPIESALFLGFGFAEIRRKCFLCCGGLRCCGLRSASCVSSQQHISEEMRERVTIGSVSSYVLNSL